MSIRVYHQLVMHLSTDVSSPQRNTVFKRDEALSGVTIDTMGKWADGGFTVADGTSKALSLGDVTSPVKGLYLEANIACSVRLSGSTDPIVLQIPSGGSLAKLFIEANITAIQVEASEGADVTGAYVVWGDETPAP